MIKQDNKKIYMVFDAIHKTMLVEENELPKEVVLSIIDSPIYQRMKGIKQLGFSDMVFPTAVHTRFSHCLGAAHLCANIMKRLNLQKRGEAKYPNTLLAVLIHDIGHGPFSHAIEPFMKSRLGKNFSHEKWTRYFIEDGVNKWGWEIDKPDIEIIDHLVRSYDCETKDDKEEYGIYADLVSSQLDADRLDYLLRDSHFCGVEYGSYDLEWLLSTLRPYKPHVNNHAGSRLAISYKGIGALENFLMNRRLMTQNIYCHRTVVGFTHIFECFLDELRNRLPNKKIKKSISPQLVKFLLRIPKKKVKESHSIDIHKFMKHSYEDYAALCDYDFWYSIRLLSANDSLKHDDRLKVLADRFYNRTAPIMIPIAEDHITAENVIKEYDPTEELWQLKVKPLPFQLYDVVKRQIVVLDESGNPEDAGNVSEVLRKMGGSYEPKYYLLVDKPYFCENQPKMRKMLSKINCSRDIFKKYQSKYCSLK